MTGTEPAPPTPTHAAVERTSELGGSWKEHPKVKLQRKNGLRATALGALAVSGALVPHRRLERIDSFDSFRRSLEKAEKLSRAASRLLEFTKSRVGREAKGSGLAIEP